MPLGNSTIASLSVVQCDPRDFIVDITEFHTNVGEGILPLDADIILHVAPAGAADTPPVAKIAAFLVPQGTLVVLKPGVWHQAPFALGAKPANVLIILPERTYANDCTVRPLTGDNRVKITPPGK